MSSTSSSETLIPRLKRLAPFLVAGLAALALWRLELDWAALFKGDFDAATAALKRAAESGGAWKPLLLCFLMVFLPFVLVPISALIFGTAVLLKPAVSIPVIVLGCGGNAALGWWVGRRFGDRFFPEPTRRKMALFRILQEGAEHGGFWMTVLARFIPSPFVIQAVIGAMVGIGFWAMVLGTMAAMLPWSFLYVFAADAIREGDWKRLAPAIAGVLVLGGAALYFKRKVPKKAMEPGGEAALAPLSPASPARGPLLTFYSLAGDEACLEARTELSKLRDTLGFEVQELDITGKVDLEAHFRDHVPVVLASKEKLFSFQVDSHVLSVYLKRHKGGQ